MSTWRYIATRFNGDGTETFLNFNVPLSTTEVNPVLNGHGGVKGTITPEIASLKTDDGNHLFVPWSTAIYAEEDGHIRGGGILKDFDDDAPKLQLDCIGHTGYLTDTRYTGVKSIERDDPLKVSKHLWDHTQTRPHFNIGIEFAGAEKSRDMFIGDDSIVPTQTPTKVTPYVLAWYQTHDLAKEFELLASLAPLEYTMTHEWNADKTAIRHILHYGYPRLGARRTDLRFVVGENVVEQPRFDTGGDSYASNVIVLGAGEGSKMMRNPTDAADPALKRLGRDAVIIDKSITTPSEAQKRADAELKLLTGTADVTEIQVRQHEHALLGSYSVGDDIRIETADGWSGIRSLWVKILGIQIRPESNVTTLQVMRAEKVSK